MKFYAFTPSVSSRFISASELVNENEIVYHSCTQCGNADLVDWTAFSPCFECESPTSRRKLPDIMAYGGKLLHSSDWWCIVSDKFKSWYEKMQFSGCRFHPVRLVYRIKNTIHDIDANYYLMLITGRAQLDFKRMQIACDMCMECGHYLFDGPLCPLYTDKGIFPALLNDDSWDGSDVFNDAVCTEAVASKILESGLTGFEFIRFEQKFDSYEKIRFISKLSQL